MLLGTNCGIGGANPSPPVAFLTVLPRLYTPSSVVPLQYKLTITQFLIEIFGFPCDTRMCWVLKREGFCSCCSVGLIDEGSNWESPPAFINLECPDTVFKNGSSKPDNSFMDYFSMVTVRSTSFVNMVQPLLMWIDRGIYRESIFYWQLQFWLYYLQIVVWTCP